MLAVWQLKMLVRKKLNLSCLLYYNPLQCTKQSSWLKDERSNNITALLKSSDFIVNIIYKYNRDTRWQLLHLNETSKSTNPDG